MGQSKGNSKREVYSKTSLPQEIRKISIMQSNLILKKKKLEKEQTKPIFSRGKKNHKGQNRNK